MSQSHNMDDMLKLIRKSVLWELLEKYPDYRYFDNTNLTRTMQTFTINPSGHLS